MAAETFTVNERMALRLWCRQALAKLEQEEVRERLLKLQSPEEAPVHRITQLRPRPSRRPADTRVKELVY